MSHSIHVWVPGRALCLPPQVFTPMLASSATGYMDFQSISNPIRNLPGVHYQQAKARDVDFEQRVVTCSDVFKNFSFEVPYDRLVIAVGCKTHTYDTPGVAENEGRFVFFLKHLHHAAQVSVVRRAVSSILHTSVHVCMYRAYVRGVCLSASLLHFFVFILCCPCLFRCCMMMIPDQKQNHRVFRTRRHPRNVLE